MSLLKSLLFLTICVFYSLAFIDSIITHLEPPRNVGPLKQNVECGYRNKRIIGGRKAATFTWPWMVSIQSVFGRHFCGGTLISVRHVLTAAHCVNTQARLPFLLSISLGSSLLNKGSSFFVRKIILHPEFAKNSTYDNDVAILVMSDDVDMSSDAAMPACLPSSDFEIRSSDSLTVLGWGRDTEYGRNSAYLNEAMVYLQDGVCTIYGREWQGDDKMICAGRVAGGTDACRGDSGGPLLLPDEDDKYQLVGIVAFGKGCARKGFPGAYTRVTHYSSWIMEIIHGEGKEQ